jgi:Ca2+-binding RTX toxin-like protein
LLGSALNGTGNDLDNELTGNANGNTLAGGGGQDWLDGKRGADIMIGGFGGDTYVVDHAGDLVMEGLNQGTDWVLSSINYTLGLHVENLSLLDDGGALNGTGNGLKNTLVGNADANVLAGGGGADQLAGGLDADILIGGTEADYFSWFSAADSGSYTLQNGIDTANIDVIMDFNAAEGDLIAVHKMDADETASGNQMFAFIGEYFAAGGFSAPGQVAYGHDGGDTYLLFNTDVVFLVQGPSGAQADYEFAIRLPGLQAPDASWFDL